MFFFINFVFETSGIFLLPPAVTGNHLYNRSIVYAIV